MGVDGLYNLVGQRRRVSEVLPAINVDADILSRYDCWPCPVGVTRSNHGQKSLLLCALGHADTFSWSSHSFGYFPAAKSLKDRLQRTVVRPSSSPRTSWRVVSSTIKVCSLSHIFVLIPKPVSPPCLPFVSVSN